MKLETIQNAFGFGRLESIIERCWRMRVEIVQHQHDLVRFRKEIIDQVLHTMSKIDLGSPFCHFDVTPTHQRLKEQKEIARAIAFVLVIKALWASGLWRQWTAFLSNQLNRMFVEKSSARLLY